MSPTVNSWRENQSSLGGRIGMRDAAADCAAMAELAMRHVGNCVDEKR